MIGRGDEFGGNGWYSMCGGAGDEAKVRFGDRLGREQSKCKRGRLFGLGGVKVKKAQMVSSGKFVTFSSVGCRRIAKLRLWTCDVA